MKPQARPVLLVRLISGPGTDFDQKFVVKKSPVQKIQGPLDEVF